MLRATFLMEQHLGHQTFYRNLRQFIEAEQDIEPTWVEVDYSSVGGLWERVPVLSRYVTGALNGRSQVRRGLAANPVDVAFYNTQVPAALGGSKTLQSPYVLSTDITPRQYDAMSEHYGHRPDRRGPARWYKHTANRRILRRAERILPWSSWAADSLIKDYGVHADKIEVVSPGVDIGLWETAGRSVAGGPLRVLFVGADLDRKGGVDLIEAFEALDAPDAELHIVTKTPIAHQNPAISVYNNLSANSSELRDLYRTCNVFVLPSKAEAFGIAAVEASASGLPVIATSSGGLKDVVADGETGYLVESGDVGALVESLRLLDTSPDLRREFGSAGRRRAEQLFDAQKNAKRTAEILNDVVAR